MDISFLGSSNREIKNMNRGKVGAPFEHSHTLSSVSQNRIQDFL
jgi:hypothetical protein